MSHTSSGQDDSLKAEIRWAVIVGFAVGIVVIAVVFAGVVLGINPPSNIEHIDPKTLHLSAEFTESNLGTRVDPNGQVTVRVVATQFAFVPSCVVVPANQPVTLRFATPDVIHGILVTGTNVNTMVVPGYVAQVHTEFTQTGDLLMPCQEYCGVGHSQMFATVRVVPAARFNPDSEGRVACEP
jgi:cytochrome c oxidase subunit 2